ncbi:TRAP transporter small permease subunit [Acuticoccus kandeliae]|uniref:TRAP transporter small permease subunit n=1 Tax=Acuticoccus kandeliae TaxID=2073160 RepID=UPI000D3E543B|nr:TRAP transporter small permease [Acuticoccus kandeliae]
MTLLSKIVERLAFGCVLLGGLGLLIAMLLGVGDVIGTFFNHPLPGALEVTESTMVLIVFGGLAYAQIRRRHIRVELAYLRAGPRLRSVMDIIASVSAIVFFSLLAWQGWNEALYSLSIKESTFGIVRFPLYPARFALVLGSVLFILQLCLDLVNDIRHFGNPPDYEIA